MRTFIRSIAFAAMGMLAASAPAAIITAVGADTTTLANWRTTTAVKTLDLDHDNVYGTAGYFCFSMGNTGLQGTPSPFQASDKNGLPSWLTVTANGANGSFSGAYGLIDNPTLTPGPSVADIHGGYAWRSGVVANTYTSLFDLNFGVGTPTGPIRIGLLLNSGSGVVNGMRLVGATTGTVSVGNTLGSFPNYAFFDVTNAANLDVVTIQGNYAVGGTDGLSGITVDLPEPTALVTLCAGAMSMFLRRRRA